eukprot:4264578-Pyramimonas_sp.AAC.1
MSSSWLYAILCEPCRTPSAPKGSHARVSSALSLVSHTDGRAVCPFAVPVCVWVLVLPDRAPTDQRRSSWSLGRPQPP